MACGRCLWQRTLPKGSDVQYDKVIWTALSGIWIEELAVNKERKIEQTYLGRRQRNHERWMGQIMRETKRTASSCSWLRPLISFLVPVFTYMINPLFPSWPPCFSAPWNQGSLSLAPCTDFCCLIPKTWPLSGTQRRKRGNWVLQIPLLSCCPYVQTVCVHKSRIWPNK